MEWLVVALFRLTIPLLILRWVLLGSVLALLADNFDVVILDFLNIQSFELYDRLDKVFDNYTHIIQGIVLFKIGDEIFKKTGLFLLGFRIFGSLLFLFTNQRELLLFFPNVFEFYFLGYFLIKFFKKDYVLNKSSNVILLIVATTPKLAQEYILHLGQFPVYQFFKSNFFPFI